MLPYNSYYYIFLRLQQMSELFFDEAYIAKKQEIRDIFKRAIHENKISPEEVKLCEAFSAMHRQFVKFEAQELLEDWLTSKKPADIKSLTPLQIKPLFDYLGIV